PPATVPAAPAGAADGGGRPDPVVLLPTGDQVTLRTDTSGRQLATVVPAADSGVGRLLVHLNLAGHAYEVPAAAMPYLGRGLDPSLFDLTALAAARRNGRLPVRIDHGAGAAAPAGVTVTADGATTTSGYLTATSARAFGRSLVAQYLADRRAGHFGGRGLFAGGTRIALAGAARKPARPAYAMHTLTVSGANPAGVPDDGDPVLVYNVDDSARFGDPTESMNWFDAGTAKFSVPAGHYAALALYFTLSADDEVTAVSLVTRPEFAVTADTGIRLDAASATSAVTMVTPRPSLAADGGFVVDRTPAAGESMYVDVQTGPGVPVRVAPTAERVTLGTLHSYPYQRRVSPPGPGVPYEYQLQYPTAGRIPARQRYVVRPADLSTVDSYYYSEKRVVGQRQAMGVYDWEDGTVSRASHPLDLPTHQTEYVTGDSSVVWWNGLAKYVDDPASGSIGWEGSQYEAAVRRTPGETIREDWNRFPLHPAGAVNLTPDDPYGSTVPAAVRQGDTDRLAFTVFSDNQPGHLGSGSYADKDTTTAGSWSVTRDGTTLATGDDPDYIPPVTVDPAPGTMTLTVDATRKGAMFALSTHTHTEWTWRTAHQQGGALPAGYECGPHKGPHAPDTDCAVEPLMTAAYAVGGMDVTGSVPSGAQGVELSLGHLPLARTAAVTGATVEYAMAGGDWRTATVTDLGGGRYRADFAVDASQGPYDGTPVSLRVTATDAAGGGLAETITDAYLVR
ncbi:MAG TPA: hypothetical protein VGN37_09930, partial [Actinocatenispora sp.]